MNKDFGLLSRNLCRERLLNIEKYISYTLFLVSFVLLAATAARQASASKSGDAHHAINIIETITFV